MELATVGSSSHRVVPSPHSLVAARGVSRSLADAATTTEALARALDQLAARAHDCGSDWVLGIELRSRALLSEGEAADELYRDAIERLGRR
jgi:uncharacterized protein YbjQ (UPF0145 family)